MEVLSSHNRPREERKKERRAAVQRRVMDATEQLLREGHAFGDLSIETIAARAGISRTTFYDYFADKRELLLALGATLISDALGDADLWLPNGDPGATKAELRDLIRSLVQMYRHPVAIAVIEATFCDMEIRAAWREEQQRHIELTVRLLRVEAERGRFQAHDSTLEARARALHWSIHGSALHEVALKQEIDEDHVVDALVDVCILGVRGVLP